MINHKKLQRNNNPKSNINKTKINRNHLSEVDSV